MGRLPSPLPPAGPEEIDMNDGKGFDSIRGARHTLVLMQPGEIAKLAGQHSNVHRRDRCSEISSNKRQACRRRTQSEPYCGAVTDIAPCPALLGKSTHCPRNCP